MLILPPRYIPTGKAVDGGMGSVTVCIDSILERKVAIKQIHLTTHERRMMDELSALLKVRSKHVVQVYDILRAGKNDVAIVEEFIDGDDLSQNWRPPASVSDFYKCLWQISSGITDVHALGVIHRDIKPNNIKIDPEGIVKIYDFGLARTQGPTAVTVGFVGTHGFAAPELYEATPVFGPAIDAYAFGATAVFLATGSLPPNLRLKPPRHLPKGYFSPFIRAIAPPIADALEMCLSASSSERPPMKVVRDLLASHLLFDKHKALVVYNGKASYINSTNRSISLNLPTVGQIEINYDGLSFRVVGVSGEVSINNRRVAVGDILPGSCVVSLGDSYRKATHRRFITFDLSHPEIVL